MEPLIFNIFSELDWQIIEYSIPHVRWRCHVLVNHPWDEDLLPIRDMHIDFSIYWWSVTPMIVHSLRACNAVASRKRPIVFCHLISKNKKTKGMTHSPQVCW